MSQHSINEDDLDLTGILEINTDYDVILEKLDAAIKRNKQLAKENNKLKRQNKYLKHLINKIKKEFKYLEDKKIHYKNGRRGSKFNG